MTCIIFSIIGKTYFRSFFAGEYEQIPRFIPDFGFSFINLLWTESFATDNMSLIKNLIFIFVLLLTRAIAGNGFILDIAEFSLLLDKFEMKY